MFVKSNILLIAGPKHFTDRQLILDSMIDIIVDVSPSKIITPDTPFDNIIAEFCYLNIEYERYYSNRSKFGKHADSRRNYEMTSHATHALIFNDESLEMLDVLYFSNRNKLNIKLINLK